MTRTKRTAAVYDAAIGRYRATCPTCGFQAVRAKAEAAEHVLAQHRVYEHEATA